MNFFYSFLALFLVFGCNGVEETGVEVVSLRVNSFTVECVGEMEGNCLLVQEGDEIGTDNWENFYYEDDIVGFNYEPGYIYDLLVKKTTFKNPPMDSSAIKYHLVKIISKEKVD